MCVSIPHHSPTRMTPGTPTTTLLPLAVPAAADGAEGAKSSPAEQLPSGTGVRSRGRLDESKGSNGSAVEVGRGTRVYCIDVAICGVLVDTGVRGGAVVAGSSTRGGA